MSVDEGGSVDHRTVAEVAASMRRLLAAIDAGEITADLDHVAYLRGAVDTLTMLAEGCTETKVSGYGQHAATSETFPQDG